MAGIDSTGFEAKTLVDIQDEMAASVRAAISPTLNTSETSIVGQIIGVSASQIRQTWEAAQDIYAARDVLQATGAALTDLCRLTGTNRRAATASTVLMTVTLAAGTYTAGSLIVHVVGDPTSRFANDAEIVTAGATIVGVPFTCEDVGPVRANAGTLTVIATPVAGFSAPTNPAEAVLGLEEESDVDLRARQRTELARKGAHTVDAIRADILEVDTVTFCAVYENDTDATVDSRPPHSFEVIVLGGTTQDLVDAIWAAKPAGIQSYGTTTGTTTDTQGQTHSVGFTRPTPVTIYVDIGATVLSGTYAGDTVLKQAITDWADANLSVGKDVLIAKIIAVCMGVEGVVDVTVEVGLSAGAGTSAANYVIAAREIASIDTGNIAVVQTVVTGAP